MEIQQFSEQYNHLTSELLQYSINANPGGNVIISPLSILLLLSIAADSSSGQTRTEILSAITDDSADTDFSSMLARYQKTLTESHSFYSANAVLVRESHKIYPAYENMLRSTYNGECFAAGNLEDRANKWIKVQTKRMIPHAIDKLSDEIELLLLNAVAFEDTWFDSYQGDMIRLGDFHNADGSVCQRQMLNGSEHSYIENENITGYTKDYSNGIFSFMGLLPRKRLKRISADSLNHVDFTDLFVSRTHQLTYTKAPEFTFSFDSQLVPMCKERGMNTIFTDQADFSPMSDYPLKAGGLTHKAFIEFNRDGTRAAAVSSLSMLAGCAPGFVEKPKRVYLTRPFVFAIVHTETGLPVFTGIVNQLD